MSSTRVSGTTGYERATERFIAASESVSFASLHEPIQHLIPTSPGRVLDIGTGTGRDAAALAQMGHEVFAVEPMQAFREAGEQRHRNPSIHWRNDSAPNLATLDADGPFTFILCHAVWHHLSPSEQMAALARIEQLLEPGGVVALGLRHGPAGAGTHVYELDDSLTIEQAKSLGLQLELCLQDQPSALPGKSEVCWSRLAFRANRATT